MNFRHLRNRIDLFRGPMTLVVIFALIAVLIVSVCIALWSTALATAAWWTALALAIAIPAITIINVRASQLAIRIGAGFQAIKQARYTDAEIALREALAMLASARPDSPWRAIVLRDLAVVTRALGNYTDAEAFGLQSVAAHEAAWGPEFRDTIFVVEELAETYLDIARYDQAQSLLERALQTREKNRERPSLELAQCLHALGRTWRERGDHEKAEYFARRAYDMARQLDSIPRLILILIRSQLADICAFMGKFEEAERLAQTLIEETKQTPGADARLVAIGLYQLAIIRQEQKRHEEAEGLLRRALKNLEKNESYRGMLGSYLLGLGQTLKSQGKWTASADCFREALTIMDETLAPEHPQIATALEIYADVLRQMGEADQADTCTHRAMQIREFHSPSHIV